MRPSCSTNHPRECIEREELPGSTCSELRGSGAGSWGGKWKGKCAGFPIIAIDYRRVGRSRVGTGRSRIGGSR